MSIRSEISQDESYQRLKRIIQHSSNISVPSLLDEIETLHLGRNSRSFSLKGMDSFKLIEAIMQDQSYRSRITEIMFSALRHVNMMEIAYNSAFELLLSKYSERLPFRTKGEREGFIKSCINPARKRIDEIYSVVTLATYIIEDIDKAGYALKNTIQALEMSTKREYAP